MHGGVCDGKYDSTLDQSFYFLFFNGLNHMYYIPSVYVSITIVARTIHRHTGILIPLPVAIRLPQWAGFESLST